MTNSSRHKDETVAGFLEVGRTDGCTTIVIKNLDWKVDRSGVGHVVLSPRQARHLASSLILHAEEAEADVAHHQPTLGLTATEAGQKHRLSASKLCGPLFLSGREHQASKSCLDRDKLGIGSPFREEGEF